MSNVLPVTTNFALLKVQILNSTISQCPQIPGNLQILIFKMISLMYKGLSLQSFVKFVFRYTQIALKTIDIEKKA